MKKRLGFKSLALGVGVFLAVFGFAARALCGVDPLDPGLPQGWTQSPGKGAQSVVIGNSTLPNRDTGRLNLLNSFSSAMCVECHTANPSGGIQNSSLPYSEPETAYRGSHFVKNYFDSTLYATNQSVAATSEKVSLWLPAGQSGKGLSKYGTVGGVNSIVRTTDNTSTQGEMICESCHNMLVNEGDQLLLGFYDTTLGMSSMCEDCHVSQASGPPNHHPMTGHTVHLDTNDPTPTGHTLNITHYTHLQGPPPPDGADTATNTLGVGYYSSNMICISCHKPHDAMTSTGARIMRRGKSKSTDPLVTNKPVNVVYTANKPDAGVNPGDVIIRKPSPAATSTGLYRQLDMPAGKYLVSNIDPLCAACH